MVWQIPKDMQRERQAVWRGAMVWGLFGLMVLAALGIQAAVRASPSIKLGEEIQAERLIARVPEGWEAAYVPGRALILAEGDLAGRRLMLKVTLEDLETGGTTLEPPRRIRVGGQDAMLYTSEQRLGRRPIVATAVVMGLGGGEVATVEVRRINEWNPTDSALVQQVARSVRIEP